LPLAAERKRLLDGGRLADHRQIGFPGQHLLEARSDEMVVVGDQEPRSSGPYHEQAFCPLDNG
jgi:hypothetical protein